jgi:Holliday junction resolvase RusA-like endonuclease
MAMSAEYFIRLPFPPSINTKIGKRYPVREHVEASNRARQVAASISDGKPLTGSITVIYYMQKGDKRLYDLGNYQKVLDDAFTEGGLWVDDSLIDHSEQHRLPYVKDEAWVYIHIIETDPMSGLAKDKLRG